MAVFERETKVSIPELRIGETLVANYASLTQTIDDEGGRETVLSESAQILWGATKESLVAQADKLSLVAQRRLAISQAEVVKLEAQKAELASIDVAEEIKP